MRVAGLLGAYPPAAIGAYVATARMLEAVAAAGHRVEVFVPRCRLRRRNGVWVSPGDPEVSGVDVVVGHAGDHGAARSVAEAAGVPFVEVVHGAVAPSGAAALTVFNSVSTSTAYRVDAPSIVCRPVTDGWEHRVDETGGAVTIVNLSKDKGVKTLWRASEKLPGHRFLGVRGGWGGRQIVPRLPHWEVWPTQSDMRAVWRETRVLAVPSVRETWGMVGVEAMTNGIPVIAHPTPGLRESLGDAGIFVDRADVGGWVEAIRGLDDPETYAEASEKASARFDELEAVFAADLGGLVTAVEALG